MGDHAAIAKKFLDKITILPDVSPYNTLTTANPIVAKFVESLVHRSPTMVQIKKRAVLMLLASNCSTLRPPICTVLQERRTSFTT